MTFAEICALQAIARAAGVDLPPESDPVVLAVAPAVRCRETGREVAPLFGQP